MPLTCGLSFVLRQINERNLLSLNCGFFFFMAMIAHRLHRFSPALGVKELKYLLLKRNKKKVKEEKAVLFLL